MDRLALDLAAQVPQGQVDAADGVHGEAAAAQVVGGLEHAIPQLDRIGGVCADQHGGERAGMVVRRGAAHDGLNGGGHGLGFADAGEPGVGMDHQDTIVIGPVEQLDQRVFRAQVNGFNAAAGRWKAPAARAKERTAKQERTGKPAIARG